MTAVENCTCVLNIHLWILQLHLSGKLGYRLKHGVRAGLWHKPSCLCRQVWGAL